jgi:hypothetical protein
MTRFLRLLYLRARQQRNILQYVLGDRGIVETPRMSLAAHSEIPAHAWIGDEASDAIGKEALGIFRSVVKHKPGLAVSHQVAEATER